VEKLGANPVTLRHSSSTRYNGIVYGFCLKLECKRLAISGYSTPGAATTWMGLRAGKPSNTLCNPIWQVTPRSSEVCTRRAISFDLLNFTVWKPFAFDSFAGRVVSCLTIVMARAHPHRRDDAIVAGRRVSFRLVWWSVLGFRDSCNLIIPY